MRFCIPKISLHRLFSNSTLAAFLLIMLCVQIVPFEGHEISAVKVAVMALTPLLFILKAPYISKALLWGILYWALCYFTALFHGNMRFSTIGYLGMFVITYIVFYNLVHCGAFTLKGFSNLLRTLILTFAIVLVLQQLCMLVGIRNMPLINLNNQSFLSLTKLPSLTLEPSHTARILTVAMLCYLRCKEIEKGGERLDIFDMFVSEEKRVTIAFLWTMLTMGSGTAFIGLGLLSLYFIRWRTVFYFVPIIIATFYIAQRMELTQFDRAYRVAMATTTGDAKQVLEQDGSAASRVIPIINTFTMDLSDKNIWVGKGTATKEYAQKGWLRTTDHTGCIDQYGLIAFVVSLVLVYTCIIKRLLSLETLLFIFLFGMGLMNIAYVWGAMMTFSVVRYFQEQRELGLLDVECNDVEETM